MAAGKTVSYSTVRRFALTCTQLEGSELVLYSAFQSPLDDIFYLPEDHPHWQALLSNTHIHCIENQEKYQTQLKFTLDSLVSSGAAVFCALEESNMIKQLWKAATHGAYYRMVDGEGSAQFRYWVSQNKHDVKKLCTFFRLQNDNKLIKEGSKIMLDSIVTN